MAPTQSMALSAKTTCALCVERFQQLVELYDASTAVGTSVLAASSPDPVATTHSPTTKTGSSSTLLRMSVTGPRRSICWMEEPRSLQATRSRSTRGLVEHFGFAPLSSDGPNDHRWLKIPEINLDSGGDPNRAGNDRNEGIVDLSNDLPVKFSAVVKVKGEMMSTNLATCTGKAPVEFIGNELTDPVGIAGVALLLGGIFGLLFNARPASTFRVDHDRIDRPFALLGSDGRTNAGPRWRLWCSSSVSQEARCGTCSDLQRRLWRKTWGRSDRQHHLISGPAASRSPRAAPTGRRAGCAFTLVRKQTQGLTHTSPWATG
jgi:hypothetical protein